MSLSIGAGWNIGSGWAITTSSTLAVYNFEGTGYTSSTGTLGQLSLSGTVTTSTAQAKSGTQSAVYGTSNSDTYWITFPQTLTTYAYNGGFTIEGFIYPTATPAAYASWVGVSDSANDYIATTDYRGLQGFPVDSRTNSGGGQVIYMTLNTWNHVFMAWYNGYCYYGSNGAYYYAPSGGPYYRDLALFPNINLATVGYVPYCNYTGSWPTTYVDQMRASSACLYVANPTSGGNGTYTVPTTPLT